MNQGVVSRSYSGQFTAREVGDRPLFSQTPNAARVPMGGGFGFLIAPPPALSGGQEEDSISWVPARLAVSAERIKEIFLRDLGLNDNWKGGVDLVIDSSLPAEKDPVLFGIQRAEGWNYQLILPKSTRQEALVRAVVQVLLTEVINRGGAQAAEAPAWLSEGMSARLQDFNLPTYVVRPNSQTAGYHDLRIEGLARVRAEMRAQSPLSFQQLCWPEQANEGAGVDEELYRSCALMFVDNLLRLEDGHVCMQRLLQELPKHLNWQTAFLAAFQPHFASLLDVEKWWGLNCATFSKGNHSASSTGRECWQKLQDALDVPVEVQMGASNYTAAAKITLQEAVKQWPQADATGAVRRAIGRLQALQYFDWQWDANVETSDPAHRVQVAAEHALRLRIAQSLNPLVAAYLVTLVNYAKATQPSTADLATGKFVRASRGLKRTTIEQLDGLDQKRELLRTQFVVTPPAKPSADQSTASANGGKLPPFSITPVP